MKTEGANNEAANLRDEIQRLKKEKNALIMAHYYQRDEIQEIADFIGDSLALARQAAKTDADVIVMCGVHFMGETASNVPPIRGAARINSATPRLAPEVMPST